MLSAAERILLGPGPSLVSPRVAPEASFAFATSGTGTSAMEVAVANLVQPGTRVLSIVLGYHGDRLAQMCQRYGGDVQRRRVGSHLRS